ncbi:hypothetical protein GCM10007423_39870 [Dyadobacter endophyticus]|uniref:Uncharacterized protein n=1 Tax=Dyadobacter endophyticus TaxID=1749036 RepID=A0ABQ1YZ06_9BACT|nr:hypothetical protein [Dyadobacter endophyticus]GGH42899.1 hypothetical protein GCM10007423_39870 [Dyadobacter endophyticus]
MRAKAKKAANVADVVKSVAKVKKPKAIIEIDKTGPLVHVTVPEFNGWIKLFVNDIRKGAYKVVDGKVSIQLSGALPNEYRIRAEVLTKPEQ